MLRAILLCFVCFSDPNIGGSDYNAAVALDKVVAEGSSVNLKCPSPVPFIDCQFKGPDGKVHKIGISGKKYKSGNVESLEKVVTCIRRKHNRNRKFNLAYP